MKFFFLFTSIIFSMGCASQENKNMTNKPHVLDFLDSENVIYETDKGYPVIYKSNDSLYTIINIFPKSIDQIICEISFINNSDSDVILYKPILPDSLIAQNDFWIYNSMSHLVAFLPLDTIKGAKYYVGSAINLPVIKPNLDSFNIITLKAFSKMNFVVNLSRYYDFKSCTRKGVNKFELTYHVQMPVIVNNRHIVGKDRMSANPEPLYYMISNFKENTRGKSLEFEIYKK